MRRVKVMRNWEREPGLRPQVIPIHREWLGARRAVAWTWAALLTAKLLPVALAQTPSPPVQIRDAPTSATIIPIDLGDALQDGAGGLAFAPSTPPPYDVTPPLSILDARVMLRDASTLLAQDAPAQPTQTRMTRATRADFMLVCVARYMRWLDQAHGTLPYYQWFNFDEVKIPSSAPETYVLKSKARVGAITALALSAHHGDAMIEQLTVIDVDRKQWQFNRPLLLQADQPRSEIYFLSIPTRVKSILLRCRQASEDAERRPRVIVRLGACSVSESAKQAVYFIQRARHDLRQWRMNDARSNVARASQLLVEYQTDRRL